MKVRDFIKWLEKQNQELEVSIVECCPNGELVYTESGMSIEVQTAEAVCFDDPHMQSRQTSMSLILGVES